MSLTPVEKLNRDARLMYLAAERAEERAWAIRSDRAPGEWPIETEIQRIVAAKLGTESPRGAEPGN